MKYLTSLKIGGQTRSIRHKIFVQMSLLAVLILIGLSLIFSGLYFLLFFRSTSEGTQSRLNTLARQIDIYTDGVRNYSLTLITDDFIQSHMEKNRRSSLLSSADTLEFRTRINHIIQASPYIYSVTFYDPDRKPVVTTDKYPMLADNVLPQTDESVWISGIKQTGITKNDRLRSFSLVRPFYSLLNGRKLGYIEITVAESTIRSLYMADTDEDRHVFITDSIGRVQSSDVEDQIGERLASFGRPNADLYLGAMIFSDTMENPAWHLYSTTSFLAFFRPMLSMLGLIALLTVFFITLCFTLSRHLSETITSPLYRLIAHTEKIKAGDWRGITDKDSGLDHDIRLLYDAFNQMLKAQITLQKNLIDTTKAKNEISLALLQQQVKPHFLYNTLDNICSLAELDEKETLTNLVMNLSTFYRLSLSSGSFHVNIRNELNLTEAYIKIMQVRYYGLFDYRIDCPENLLDVPCLKLILQPIVENSIYHGLKEKGADGMLTIRVSADGASYSGENITVTIEDNGVGFQEDRVKQIWEQPDHFGIRNIYDRLKLQYKDRGNLEMMHRPGGGSITVLTFPCIRAGHGSAT